MISTRSSANKSSSKELSEEPVSSQKVSRKKSKILKEHNIEALQDIAHMMRIDSIEMCEASKSGHPSSCSSMADILAVLFLDEVGMLYNPKSPKLFTNDRFVLSKGHAAPILWFLDKHELKTLRKFNSDLEGHPTTKLPFVDVATGSLGQGLSVAAGMAYSSKYLDKINNTFFCLMGDGECAEGSVWEAANFASHYKLDNLIGIVDVNRLGQSGPTMFGHDVDSYKKRFQAFGWNAIVVNGHDITEIIEAFEKARNYRGAPSVIIAKTHKGKLFLGKIDDQLNWHGKALGSEAAEVITNLKTLIKNPDAKLEPKHPDIDEWKEKDDHILVLPELDYTKGKDVAVRVGYGNALKRLGKVDANRVIVALDGDTKNSTMSEYFQKEYQEQFIDCFIAEQNLVGVAQGLSCRGKVPFASAFGAFFSRAFDQIRMGAISQVNVKYVGSHCGVSIGEDGPSQMALEDLAMFRTLPGSTVLYPSDAVSCERAVELAANSRGIFYIRTSRPATPVLYDNHEKFEIGRAKLFRRSDKDLITIISSGVTFVEAIKAADSLGKDGIHVRLLDLFSIKPIDKATLQNNIEETHGRALTIEDHYPEGGIYEAVCSALSEHTYKIYHISVTTLPRSGKPEELLDYYSLSAAKIEEYVKKIVEKSD